MSLSQSISVVSDMLSSTMQVEFKLSQKRWRRLPHRLPMCGVNEEMDAHSAAQRRPPELVFVLGHVSGLNFVKHASPSLQSA